VGFAFVIGCTPAHTTPDGGGFDGGAFDGGRNTNDAGSNTNDAGPNDAGSIDAGQSTPDAGGNTTDAGFFIAVPLEACNPAVYTASVTLGGSQTFQLLLDTGSTTLAVAGANCPSCRDAGASPLYQPGPSATDENMTAAATYGALVTTGWSGEIFEDDVTPGTPPSSTGTARVKLVSIQQQDEFLVGSCGTPGATPQGLIGFAPSLSATTGTDGYFDDLVAGGAVPNVFATQLCPNGGTLWLGGYDPAAMTAPPVFTPMAPPGFDAYVYTVSLVSIAVSGTTVPIQSGVYTAALIDTGSDITSLSPDAFSALTTAIQNDSAFAQTFGSAAASFFASQGNCIHLDQTKEVLDATLPPLTLTFGANPTVTVQAAATESYLLSPGSGLWCPALTSRALTPNFQSIAAILGAPMLRSNVVIFDRANERIGFAPHAPCP
jgi:hypothetical protein